MELLPLALFSAVWTIGLYLINSLIARQFKRVSLRPMLLYVCALAMLGVYGETIFGNVYDYIFGHPLWRYTVLPIHHGYTSKFALVLWGSYGFYLYLMHDNLVKRSAQVAKYLPFIFCLEAVAIELAVNVTYRLVFGKFLFYYVPGDLWHLTSLQTLPRYLAGGFAINAMLRRGRSDPLFFAASAAAFATVLVFLT